MKQITLRQKRLMDEAHLLEAALRASEERTEVLRIERIHSMRGMHEAGVSWAEIGRIFGVTPQAAMYATGHIKRQDRPTKRSPAQQEPETRKPRIVKG